LSNLKSTSGIPANGNQEGRPMNSAAKNNVRKGKEISYPSLPDAGEAPLLEGQESGPNSPGRMPKRMSGGGT